MSYEMCDTVIIKGLVSDGNPTGATVINKADFVEGEHELYTDEIKKTVKPVVESKKAEAAADGVPKEVEAPVQPWAKT